MKYLIYIVFLMVLVFPRAQEVHVSRIQDLDFGKFYMLDAGMGKIRVHKDGAWEAEGSIRHVEVLPRPAVFTIWTESLRPVKIKIQRIYSKLAHSDDPWELEVLDGQMVEYHTISHDRPIRIGVGAELIVGPMDAMPGTYYGQLLVSVSKVP